MFQASISNAHAFLQSFFQTNLYAIDFVPLRTHFCFRRSKKNPAETRFSTFTAVQFIWSDTSYAMKYGWEHEKLLVRRSPVKASNFTHLTKSFCTPLILHSSRVLFRVTVYRVYKNRYYGNEGSDKLQRNKQAHLGPWHSVPLYQTYRTFQTASYKMSLITMRSWVLDKLRDAKVNKMPPYPFISTEGSSLSSEDPATFSYPERDEPIPHFLQNPV